MRGKWLVLVASVVVLNVCAQPGWTSIIIPDPAQVTETGSWTQGFHLFTNSEEPLQMSFFNSIRVANWEDSLLFEKSVFHFYGTDKTYATEDTSWTVVGSTPADYGSVAAGTGFSMVTANTSSEVKDLYFSVQFLPEMGVDLEFLLTVSGKNASGTTTREPFGLAWDGTARKWSINDTGHGLMIVPEASSHVTWLFLATTCACMTFVVRRRKAAVEENAPSPRRRWSDENRKAIYAIIGRSHQA